METFSFFRPGEVELPGTPFWWEGPNGGRILTYRPEEGGYQNERDDMIAKLDRCLATATNKGSKHIGCYYGLGNHGGGPTRRHLVSLAFLQGLSHPEIAAATGLALGTVKSHLRRALMQLRKDLEAV